jgi:hypothetical protein
MKQRFFLNRNALNRENTRIWNTHYEPKPAHDHISSWQEMLAEHRQVVAEVLEIAAETGWTGELPMMTRTNAVKRKDCP